MQDALGLLAAAQAGLRARFDDFRRALERREAPAYRLALADLQENLARWTAAEERALLPALERAALADRDPRRELTLEYVQLRELTRHLREQIETGARMSDILGLVENLARRFDAHESGVLGVYYPAAVSHLTPAERRALELAATGL